MKTLYWLFLQQWCSAILDYGNRAAHVRYQPGTDVYFAGTEDEHTWLDYRL